MNKQLEKNYLVSILEYKQGLNPKKNSNQYLKKFLKKGPKKDTTKTKKQEVNDTAALKKARSKITTIDISKDSNILSLIPE